MIKLSKKAKKALNKVDLTSSKKILESLQESNIRKLAATNPVKYRIKVYHYRLILEKEQNDYVVKSILTKTNTSFRRTKCCH